MIFMILFIPLNFDKYLHLENDNTLYSTIEIEWISSSSNLPKGFRFLKSVKLARFWFSFYCISFLVHDKTNSFYRVISLSDNVFSTKLFIRNFLFMNICSTNKIFHLLICSFDEQSFDDAKFQFTAFFGPTLQNCFSCKMEAFEHKASTKFDKLCPSK